MHQKCLIPPGHTRIRYDRRNCCT